MCVGGLVKYDVFVKHGMTGGEVVIALDVAGHYVVRQTCCYARWLSQGVRSACVARGCVGEACVGVARRGAVDSRIRMGGKRLVGVEEREG
jgi:hypothetical protein